jgi:hypothetical protein
MEVLFKVREANAAVFFLQSASFPPLDADFSPLISMYPIPNIAFYGSGFHIADLALVCRFTKSDIPQANLPVEVSAVLSENNVENYEFFWNITDASSLIASYGNKLNLVNHCWAYQHDLNQYHPRLRMADLFPMGAFTFAESFIEPTQPVCLPFQCLDPLRISVHAQSGGMCCSPNNARFVALTSPHHSVSYMWTVTLRREKSGRHTAAVCLQWILTQRNEAILSAIASSKTLMDLLTSLGPLMADRPCFAAACVAFGQRPASSLPRIASPPAHCQKRQLGPAGKYTPPADATAGKAGPSAASAGGAEDNDGTFAMVFSPAFSV